MLPLQSFYYEGELSYTIPLLNAFNFPIADPAHGLETLSRETLRCLGIPLDSEQQVERVSLRINGTIAVHSSLCHFDVSFISSA